MADLERRPILITPDTTEAEVLGLVVEGVCSRRVDFDGFCSVEGAQLKTALSNLKRKGFIRYLKKYKSWRPTSLGTEAYDDMQEGYFKPEVKDIVAIMFTALVDVSMRHKSKIVREDASAAIEMMQNSIHVKAKGLSS